MDDQNQDFSNKKQPGIAPHQLRASMDYESKKLGFYGNLDYNFVSSFVMNFENTDYSDAYHLMNLRLGYKKEFGRFSFDVFGGIQNLGNVQYSSLTLTNASRVGGQSPAYYYARLPRNYYGGIGLKYIIY